MSRTRRGRGRARRVSAALLCVLLAACAESSATEGTSSTVSISVQTTTVPATIAPVATATATSDSASIESTPASTSTTTDAPPPPPSSTDTVASSDAPPPASSPATSDSAPTPRRDFLEGPCNPLPSEAERVVCGYLELPERHADPGERTIRMAVAIVEPSGPPAGPEPLVFLAGGPGFGSVGSVELMLADAPVERTIVLVDYRGVGRSAPSLHCVEDDDFGDEFLGLPPDDPTMNARSDGALDACRDRLVAEGIDLAAYNYEEIAADLDALRAALGHERWDLWGFSNGGRVALEVVRRYPGGVRSLVLDAPAPPQGNLQGDLWPNAALAFDRLFAACKSDQICGAAYPELEATYERLVGGLRDGPVEAVVPGLGDRPAVTVLFSDNLALNALREALYETPLIPLLPFYITDLGNGRSYDVVAQLVVDRSGDSDAFSDGMNLTVNCREEIAFLPADHFVQLADTLPFFAPVIEQQDWFDTCERWDVGEGDAVLDDPVVSDVPALVLVGEFDPVHPPSTVRTIVEDGLTNSTLVEVPGYGHGTIFFDTAACPAALVARFLDDPHAPVDTTCVAAMTRPAWFVP